MTTSARLAPRAPTARRRAPRWTAATSGALLGLALLAPPARAQNADAEALFTEAERLEKAGEVDGACDAFEASNRIEPRAGTLIRLGQCRETQGRLASAWSSYKDALTRVKDPKKKAIAEARVADLEPRLSYLTVLVPDESRVDGLTVTRNGVTLDAALWNRAAPVDGGAFTIQGQAPGHEAWSTTVEVAVERDRASVEVPRFKALRTLAPDATGSAGDAGGAGDAGVAALEDRRPPPSAFTGRRKLALGLAGVGLLGVAAGVALGMQASGLEDEAFALCPDPAMPCEDAAAAQDALDRGRSRALFANVAYGVGGAVAVTAVVLWITGGPAARPAKVSRLQPRFDGTVAGLDVAWRF